MNSSQEGSWWEHWPVILNGTTSPVFFVLEADFPFGTLCSDQLVPQSVASYMMSAGWIAAKSHAGSWNPFSQEQQLYIWVVSLFAKGCFICCSERGCCREARAVVQLLLFLSSRSNRSVGAVQISAASSLLCFINVKAAEENQGGDPALLDLPDECFVKSSYQIWRCCWCCFRRKMQFLLSLALGSVWSSARE